MPTHIKLLLSAIVVVLSGLIAWMELHGDQGWLAWVVGAIAAIMIFGLWVFPEAGGGKPERKS